MDAAFKSKWCEALRSGEYEQGHNALKTTEGYCCLGVATELLRREDPEIGHWTASPYETGRWDFVKNGAHADGARWIDGFYMPPYLMEEIDLHPETAHKLSLMNDSGASFRDIADEIENL